MARGIAQVWNEWGIQILVLLSFVWQVILLVTAGIRRRRAHFLLRFLLWLAYVLADSTAIYTLGHLSFISQAREHRLVAFWAPFLLVHLGGPDSITAYSIEDNRLWRRHFSTLAVQVAGAAFVIYKYVYGTGTLILFAATLMFVVGVLKYGERTWALKCGSMDSIRSTVDSSKEDSYRSVLLGDLKFPIPDERREKMSDDDLLLSAHSLFHMCKSLFVDLSRTISTYKLFYIGFHAAEDLYNLVEMELSLMYDILYTKATVIHTWHGYCIRVISLLGTTAALLLFQFSNRSGYNRVDVVITYVLLAGALVLEVLSVIRILGSTWTCAMLYCKDWKRALNVLKFIRRRGLIKAARKRWLSDSIGQYNMFHLCTRDTTELGSRVASKIWLEDKWNRMHFSGTLCFREELKELLLQTLPKIDARNSRGTMILDIREFRKEQAEWCHWALNTSFDQSIIVWHIATELYLCEHMHKHGKDDQATFLAEAIQVLSNYMMHLLVEKPDMLPGVISQWPYANTCNTMDNLWRPIQTSQIESESAGQNQNNLVTAVKKVFYKDCPDNSNWTRVTKKVELARKMLTTFGGDQQSLPAEVKSLGLPFDGSACMLGTKVAEEFLLMESVRPDLDMRQMIFEVWVHILCYAAHHCSRDSHAKRLNSGGEFITVVWVLTEHLLMQPHLAHVELNEQTTATTEMTHVPLNFK